jgi:hypothetical protein
MDRNRARNSSQRNPFGDSDKNCVMAGIGRDGFAIPERVRLMRGYEQRSGAMLSSTYNALCSTSANV